MFIDSAGDRAIYRDVMDGSGRLWPRADLRVGDADRQAVVAELQRHYIDGRLTSDELGDRVAKALNARTFGELAVPVSDLPSLSAESSAHLQAHADRRWQLWPPPLGAALILIGILAMLWLWVLPTAHLGMFPFWPVLIWGFFFIGRPYRGGRRRF